MYFTPHSLLQMFHTPSFSCAFYLGNDIKALWGLLDSGGGETFDSYKADHTVSVFLDQKQDNMTTSFFTGPMLLMQQHGSSHKFVLAEHLRSQKYDKYSQSVFWKLQFWVLK